MSAAVAIQSAIRFDRAEVLILDPHPGNGEALRSHIRLLGMHRIKLVANIAEAASAARANSWDLFLADITDKTDGICALVRSMREGRMSTNPFLHIVLLAWKLDNDLVRQSVTCGADEFVTRPFSASFLDARLKAMISNRPDFVVTGEYIGPDRRRDRDRDKGLKTFVAPNSFKSKCLPGFNPSGTAAALRTQIRSTCAMLNAERIPKAALRLCALVSLLQDAFTSMDPLEPGLEQLHSTASDLIDRARNSGNNRILEIAEPIMESIVGAQDGKGVAAHIETVARLSTELYFLIDATATHETLRRQIDHQRAAIKSMRR
jgi:DNA-binding NarL/FixJ family response regulator